MTRSVTDIVFACEEENGPCYCHEEVRIAAEALQARVTDLERVIDNLHKGATEGASM